MGLRELATIVAAVWVGFVPTWAWSADVSKPPPPGRGAGGNFTEKAYADGMAAAPKLISEANLKCDVTQALDEGDATLFDTAGKRVGVAHLFEVACSNDLGYLITSQWHKPPNVIDCVAGAGTGRIACMLPENRHPPSGLISYLKVAGRPCRPARARFVARDETLKIRRYDVACGLGNGLMLDIPLADGSGPAPVAVDCLSVGDECRFTSHRDSVALLAYRLGRPLAKVCAMSDARYLGRVEAHDADLYEVGCRTGQESQLVEVSRASALASVRPCSSIKLKGAACELKAVDEIDPLIAMAEQSGAPEPSSGGSPIVVTRPDWVSRPSGDAMGRAYPDKAQRYGISGQATLICRVTETGSMRDCYVIDESPAQFGFGAAALKVSASFRMRPQTANGRPVDGAVVNIPINFVIARR